jgi:hypothetical protein
MSLVAERAEIEKMYSKQLKTWAAKWNNLIEKGKLVWIINPKKFSLTKRAKLF